MAELERRRQEDALKPAERNIQISFHPRGLAKGQTLPTVCPVSWDTCSGVSILACGMEESLEFAVVDFCVSSGDHQNTRPSTRKESVFGDPGGNNTDRMCGQFNCRAGYREPRISCSRPKGRKWL